MQITVKESKVLKSGSNKKGDWQLIKVVDEHGTPYTSFDKKSLVTPGAVLDIGDPEPADRAGEFKFTKCTIVSLSQATAPGTPSAPGGAPAPVPNYGLELELLKRRSIEGQTAISEIGIWLRGFDPLGGALHKSIPDNLLVEISDLYWKGLKRSLNNFLDSKPSHLADAALKIGAEKLPAGSAGTPTVAGINLVLLRSLYPKLHWTDGTVMSYIEFAFKPVKRLATLEETLNLLNTEQKALLIEYASGSAAKMA